MESSRTNFWSDRKASADNWSSCENTSSSPRTCSWNLQMCWLPNYDFWCWATVQVHSGILMPNYFRVPCFLAFMFSYLYCPKWKKHPFSFSSAFNMSKSRMQQPFKIHIGCKQISICRLSKGPSSRNTVWITKRMHTSKFRSYFESRSSWKCTTRRQVTSH